MDDFPDDFESVKDQNEVKEDSYGEDFEQVPIDYSINDKKNNLSLQTQESFNTNTTPFNLLSTTVGSELEYSYEEEKESRNQKELSGNNSSYGDDFVSQYEEVTNNEPLQDNLNTNSKINSLKNETNLDEFSQAQSSYEDDFITSPDQKNQVSDNNNRYTDDDQALATNNSTTSEKNETYQENGNDAPTNNTKSFNNGFEEKKEINENIVESEAKSEINTGYGTDFESQIINSILRNKLEESLGYDEDFEQKKETSVEELKNINALDIDSKIGTLISQNEGSLVYGNDFEEKKDQLENTEIGLSDNNKAEDNLDYGNDFEEKKDHLENTEIGLSDNNKAEDNLDYGNDFEEKTEIIMDNKIDSTGNITTSEVNPGYGNKFEGNKEFVSDQTISDIKQEKDDESLGYGEDFEEKKDGSKVTDESNHNEVLSFQEDFSIKKPISHDDLVYGEDFEENRDKIINQPEIKKVSKDEVEKLSSDVVLTIIETNLTDKPISPAKKPSILRNTVNKNRIQSETFESPPKKPSVPKFANIKKIPIKKKKQDKDEDDDEDFLNSFLSSENEGRNKVSNNHYKRTKQSYHQTNLSSEELLKISKSKSRLKFPTNGLIIFNSNCNFYSLNKYCYHRKLFNQCENLYCKEAFHKNSFLINFYDKKVVIFNLLTSIKKNILKKLFNLLHKSLRKLKSDYNNNFYTIRSDFLFNYNNHVKKKFLLKYLNRYNIGNFLSCYSLKDIFKHDPNFDDLLIEFEEKNKKITPERDDNDTNDDFNNRINIDDKDLDNILNNKTSNSKLSVQDEIYAKFLEKFNDFEKDFFQLTKKYFQSNSDKFLRKINSLKEDKSYYEDETDAKIEETLIKEFEGFNDDNYDYNPPGNSSTVLNEDERYINYIIDNFHNILKIPKHHHIIKSFNEELVYNFDKNNMHLIKILQNFLLDYKKNYNNLVQSIDISELFIQKLIDKYTNVVNFHWNRIEKAVYKVFKLTISPEIIRFRAKIQANREKDLMDNSNPYQENISRPITRNNSIKDTSFNSNPRPSTTPNLTNTKRRIVRGKSGVEILLENKLTKASEDLIENYKLGLSTLSKVCDDIRDVFLNAESKAIHLFQQNQSLYEEYHENLSLKQSSNTKDLQKSHFSEGQYQSQVSDGLNQDDHLKNSSLYSSEFTGKESGSIAYDNDFESFKDNKMKESIESSLTEVITDSLISAEEIIEEESKKKSEIDDDDEDYPEEEVEIEGNNSDQELISDIKSDKKKSSEYETYENERSINESSLESIQYVDEFEPNNSLIIDEEKVKKNLKKQKIVLSKLDLEINSLKNNKLAYHYYLNEIIKHDFEKKKKNLLLQEKKILDLQLKNENLIKNSTINLSSSQPDLNSQIYNSEGCDISFFNNGRLINDSNQIIPLNKKKKEKKVKCYHCKKLIERNQGKCLPSLIAFDNAKEKVYTKMISPSKSVEYKVKRVDAFHATLNYLSKPSNLLESNPKNHSNTSFNETSYSNYGQTDFSSRPSSSSPIHQASFNRIFCTWECCKRWSLKSCPLQQRYHTDLLIDITAGYPVRIND